MLDKERTQRAIKEEQEAFAALLAERKLTRELIGKPDKLLASKQVPWKGFDKLHLAAQRYKAAIGAIRLAAQEDAALAQQEPWYMKKLSEQMTEVDSLLSQVCNAMNMLKLPVKLVTGQKCKFRAKCLHWQINFRINTAQALIKTKFNIVSAYVINLRAQDALP